MMTIEPSSHDGIVRDGFSGIAVPVPRDPGEVRLTLPAPGEDADAGLPPAFAGGSMANSVGGILYLGTDSRSDGGAAAGKTPGVLALNLAAGPAQEQDSEEDDDRALTTDISPSD